MEFKRKLPIPKEIKELYPLSDKGIKTRQECVATIKGILEGVDSRMLLLVGPCSADREDAVLDYLQRLKILSEKVSDKIYIVPRLYTSKPRTSGNAYKGMLHRPDPSGEDDILKGIIAIRQMHLSAIEKIGFGCADEMLYPENHRFISDLLCYVTIGARSVDDQQHKLTASGLEIPVGLKNPMNGNLDALLQDILTVQNSHLFLYRNWEVESEGNPFAHGILRGYVDHTGESHCNCDASGLALACRKMLDGGVKNPSLVVDCNHSNSGKDYLKQVDLARNICALRREGEGGLRETVKGLMIESYIEDGKQEEHGAVYGKSITDACLGWEKTEKLVLELADIW